MFKKYILTKIDKIKKQISVILKKKEQHLVVINMAENQIKSFNISESRDLCLFNQWFEVKYRENKYIYEIEQKIIKLNFKLNLYDTIFKLFYKN